MGKCNKQYKRIKELNKDFYWTNQYYQPTVRKCQQEIESKIWGS